VARKSSTPPPPRRGPKQRTTPSAPLSDAERRQRMILYAVAGSGLAALAAVLIFLFAFGGGSATDDARAALTDAGCTLESFAAKEGTHITDFDAKPKEWNSYPPTSGPHHVQPAVYGFYDEPVNLVQALHNLEHGAVAVYWGEDVADAEVEKIRAWYDEDQYGLIGAPLPDLGNKITLSAWTADEGATRDPTHERGWLATCTRFDEDAFAAFLDAYQFEGPERFPKEQLAPGLQ
jgi:hypothetical protein